MPTGSVTPPYRHEGKDTLIEIRLREVRQLFNTLDPAPFRERDLNESAVQYLVEACREARTHRRLRLVVYLPAAEAGTEAARTLEEAVHNYFAYREHQSRTDIRQLLRYGVISMLIGLLFLIACLGLRRAIVASLGTGDLLEGLVILGSVAMWRPAETLLYDWWPLAQRGVLLRRLSGIPVDIRTRD